MHQVKTERRCPDCGSSRLKSDGSEGYIVCLRCDWGGRDGDTEVVERKSLAGPYGEALNERDAAEAALLELVQLKFGPRDQEYLERKPKAWEAAREVLIDRGLLREKS